jgi:predicted  nucleic acid-binding Zn-ribbon protein
MNKLTLIGGSGVLGLAIGLMLNGGAKPSTFVIAGAMIAFSGGLTMVVADTKSQGKINQIESKLSDTKSEKHRLSLLVDTMSQEKADLAHKLSLLKQELEKMKVDLLDKILSESSKSLELNRLNQLVAIFTSKTSELEGEIARLRDENESMEECFQDAVRDAANQQFQEALRNEIKKNRDDCVAILQEALTISTGYRQLTKDIYVRHQEQRDNVLDINAQFNAHIEECQSNFAVERDGYLTQIDLLNEKVAALQQKLAGDLIQPEYGKFGYAVEGKIANDLARRVWEDLQIPLAVKGYQVKADGSVDVGYAYSRSITVEALVTDLSRHSTNLAKWLGIHKISSIRKLEIADLLVVTFRREPAVKEDTVKLLAGTADEFIAYVTSHPIRYRLIADPGQGKTPVTAVMVSEILKVGGTRGNTGKGKKIPHTLVTVSCPDVESSQKDADYPLEIFLKYGNTTAAVKSFDDALQDWQYRKRDIAYAENFFQLWVWDELDNTLSNCSDPKETGKNFKEILKQCHHTGVGWIVSGQSLMTSQIPGFMDDDRELFTQIIIGTSKIRKYLEKYGKKILSAKIVTQLLKNLDDLEPYIEDKNSMVTDAARLLRLGLVLDDKSPKLYFLPNLDGAKFDAEKLEFVIIQASHMKRQFLVRASGKNGSSLANEAQNACSESVGEMVSDPPFPTIGGSDHSSRSNQIPHCPHCGGRDLKVIENGKRYQCKGCTKRFVTSKVIWK